MTNARMLGNYVAYLAKIHKISNSDLSNLVGCTEHQLDMFLRGRAFLSYSKLQKLSNYFGISVEELLVGNQDIYNQAVVHCVKQFNNGNNRELILDIIDQYIDIADAIA